MYEALEGLGLIALPSEGWASALDSGLVSNLGRYRRYNFASLRDLLRVIRNKHSHFRELPPELQQRLGPLPTGFLDYFTSRFPQLLLCCYYFAARWLASDPVFQKYLPPKESEELAGKLGPPPGLRRPLLEIGQLFSSPQRGVETGHSEETVIMRDVPWEEGRAVLPRRTGQPACDFYVKTGNLSGDICMC